MKKIILIIIILSILSLAFIPYDGDDWVILGDGTPYYLHTDQSECFVCHAGASPTVWACSEKRCAFVVRDGKLVVWCEDDGLEL